RAGLGHGLVPGGEFALRVAGTSIESPALAGAPNHNLTRASPFRAGNAERLPLHVLAVGIIATCREFPEATMLNDKVIPALRALLLERCIAHGFGSAILSDNLFGITTFRITGAGQ